MAGETGNSRNLATQATAGARYVRISAFKVRQVAVLIRGKPIDEARRILAFTPKLASRHLSKVLESAIANAEHNFQIPTEELFVRGASADEGPTAKRIRPRAQGRAYRIRKRTTHIKLVLERAAEGQDGAGRAGTAGGPPRGKTTSAPGPGDESQGRRRAKWRRESKPKGADAEKGPTAQSGRSPASGGPAKQEGRAAPEPEGAE